MATIPATCHFAYRVESAGPRARDSGPSMAARRFSQRVVVESEKWALRFDLSIANTWALIAILKTSGALRWTPPNSADAIAVRVVPGTVRSKMLQGLATTTFDVERMFGIAVPSS